jgi:hypothetical protein
LKKYKIHNIPIGMTKLGMGMAGIENSYKPKEQCGKVL